MISTTSMSYVLDEVVSAVAYEVFYDEPFALPVLFDMRTTTRRRERLASIGGLREYAEKTKGSEPAEDDIAQQFQKDFIPVSYGKQVPIERELVDDEEWGLLVDIGEQLGYMGAYTMEKLAASLWNDMFTGSTFLAEDSLSICNDAHVNADSGNSQDNSGTNSLNFNGLKATRTAMRKFTNYEGDKIAVRPKMLVVPTDLEEEGWELVKSVGKPDTANNNANFYNGMFDMLVWDFLTDTNAWFMVDPRLMKMNLIWFMRIALEIFGTGNLFAGTRKIGGYFRAALGCRDWRFVYGNNPS